MTAETVVFRWVRSILGHPIWRMCWNIHFCVHIWSKVNVKNRVLVRIWARKISGDIWFRKNKHLLVYCVLILLFYDMIYLNCVSSLLTGTLFWRMRNLSNLNRINKSFAKYVMQKLRVFSYFHVLLVNT